MRDVPATDDSDKIPYDTSTFEGLRPGSFMFFRTPDDIKGLDFGNGDCVNNTVPQTIVYGWQNLPHGVTIAKKKSAGARTEVAYAGWLLGAALAWWMI